MTSECLFLLAFSHCHPPPPPRQCSFAASTLLFFLSTESKLISCVLSFHARYLAERKEKAEEDKEAGKEAPPAFFSPIATIDKKQAEGKEEMVGHLHSLLNSSHVTKPFQE